MADDCCNSFGGVITIQAGDARLSARGDISIMPSSITVEAASNQDGSDYFTTKNVPVGWEASINQPCDLDVVALLRRCSVNVTIVEEDNNRTHLFTGGRLIGEPKLNLSTGELEGVMGRGGKYRRI